MSKRTVVASLMDHMGLSAALIYAKRVGAARLPILAYHRILPTIDESTYPFDPALISADPDSFRVQLKLLKKYFSPIKFNDLLQSLDGKKRLPNNPILITFDDGFEDNYTYAYPLLAEARVPATFFVSTGYLDAQKTFWFDWLSCIVMRTASNRIEIEQLQVSYDLFKTRSSRRKVFATIVQMLKKVPNEVRLSIIDELDQKYGSAYEELTGKERSLSLPMASSQLREMARAGMETGSHTVSHAILSRLSQSELQRELVQSRERLESLTGQGVEVLSYPNGGSADFNDEVIKVAKKSGYRTGVSYISGDNNARGMDLYSLKRIHIERDVTESLFKLFLAMPNRLD